MAASTIPAAKAALLALIAARADLVTDAVHVAWGIPGEVPAAAERIYVGDVIDVGRVWAALGLQRMDETYTLQVHVETWRGGDEQTATEERLWVLVNEVEQAVRADLKLSNTVRVAQPGRIDASTFPTDGGWVANATVRFVCQARI